MTVLWNGLGLSWRVAALFLATPFYLNILGPDNYSYVGLYSVIFVWTSLLDVGLRPMITRQAALYSSNNLSAMELAKEFQTVLMWLIIVGLCTTALALIFSEWLSKHLNSLNTVGNVNAYIVFLFMGGLISLRMIEGLYLGLFQGLSCFKIVNLSIIFSSTIQHLVVILLIYTSTYKVEVFFFGTVLVIFCNILCLNYLKLKSAIKSPTMKKVSLTFLNKQRNFISGIALTALIGTLVAQFDKSAAVNLLSSERFSFYMIAALFASSLDLLASPFAITGYPAFVSLYSQAKFHDLRIKFSAFLMVSNHLIFTVAVILYIFCQDILLIWLGTYNSVYLIEPIAKILLVASALHCLNVVPYHFQLALGNSKIGFQVNLIAIAIGFVYYLSYTDLKNGLFLAWLALILSLSKTILSYSLMIWKSRSFLSVNILLVTIFKPLCYTASLNIVILFLRENSLGFLNNTLFMVITILVNLIAFFILHYRLVSEELSR